MKVMNLLGVTNLIVGAGFAWIALTGDDALDWWRIVGAVVFVTNGLLMLVKPQWMSKDPDRRIAGRL